MVRSNAAGILVAMERRGEPMGDDELKAVIPHPELYEETVSYLVRKGLIRM